MMLLIKEEARLPLDTIWTLAMAIHKYNTDAVTSIGISAFEGCSGPREVTIPASLKSIPKDAFPKKAEVKRVK